MCTSIQSFSQFGNSDKKRKLLRRKSFKGERRDTRKGLNSNQFESLSGHWPPGRKHSRPGNIRSILSIELGPQIYLVNWTWTRVGIFCLLKVEHCYTHNRSILSIELGPSQTYLVNWTWITVRHILDLPCLSRLLKKEHSHTIYTSSHDWCTFF